jgi:hypothetical protein
LIRAACLTVLIASSAWAADAKLCDRFVNSYSKASKKAKAPTDATAVNFMKKRCTTQPNDEVKKNIECLDKVKDVDALDDCMR